jgi:hypothetical protein
MPPIFMNNRTAFSTLKGLFYGRESNSDASLSRVCDNLLKEIESLEKDLKPQLLKFCKKAPTIKRDAAFMAPYAIDHDLSVRLFTQHASSMWDDIAEIAHDFPALAPLFIKSLCGWPLWQ